MIFQVCKSELGHVLFSNRLRVAVYNFIFKYSSLHFEHSFFFYLNELSMTVFSVLACFLICLCNMLHQNYIIKEGVCNSGKKPANLLEIMCILSMTWDDITEHTLFCINIQCIMMSCNYDMSPRCIYLGLASQLLVLRLNWLKQIIKDKALKVLEKSLVWAPLSQLLNLSWYEKPYHTHPPLWTLSHFPTIMNQNLSETIIQQSPFFSHVVCIRSFAHSNNNNNKNK